MSLFAEYLKEREGKEVLETEVGFAIYSFNGTECYLSDIFVRAGLRRSGAATELADEVSERARIAGCKILSGSVNPRLKSATTSIKVLLGYGMQLHSSSQDALIFVKEL